MYHRRIPITLLTVWIFLACSFMAQSENKVSDKYQDWLHFALNAYRKGTDKFLPLPKEQPNQASNVSLSRLFQHFPKGSIEATAVAYYGAMQHPQETVWIERMVLAAKQEWAATYESDSREFLPQALAQVYSKSKSPGAIEALLSLHLDGHYQETLNATRIALLFQVPHEFGDVLHEMSETKPNVVKVFEQDFAYALKSEPSWLTRARILRKKYSTSRRQSDLFLSRFLTKILSKPDHL